MKPIYLLLEGVLLILLVLFLVGQSMEKENEEKIQETKPVEYFSSMQVMEGEEKILPEIQSVLYDKDGVKAAYPEFKTGTSASYNKNVMAWNRLISDDFNRILMIYAFRPFPEATLAPSANIPTLLKISYSIKVNNDKRTSIFYTAEYNSPYSAHPSGLVYTTNIDKKNNKRVRLNDYVTVNKEFVEDFRSWKLNTDITEPELLQAIHDYIANISDEDLLKGFLAADHIGSDNPWGIYSYTTQNNLGISIQAPNYIGDHIEFEKPLSELQNFLKGDYIDEGMLQNKH